MFWFKAATYRDFSEASDHGDEKFQLSWHLLELLLGKSNILLTCLVDNFVIQKVEKRTRELNILYLWPKPRIYGYRTFCGDMKIMLLSCTTELLVEMTSNAPYMPVSPRCSTDPVRWLWGQTLDGSGKVCGDSGEGKGGEAAGGHASWWQWCPIPDFPSCPCPLLRRMPAK